MITKCFACDRKLGQNPHHVDTRDDQWVRVGTECYKEIKKSGEKGWRHPKGGLRLWTIPDKDWLTQAPRITGGGTNL